MRPGRSKREGLVASDHGEALFRAIYDQAVDLAAIVDLDGVLRHANRTALEFLGKDLSELVGRRFWDTPWWAGLPEEQAKVQSGIERARHGEFVQFETAHRAADGSPRQVDFTLKPARDQDGRVFCLIAEGRDITARRAAEEALREKTRELDRYFMSALDLLCIADTDGYFRRLNREWESTLGYSLQELENTRFLDYVHPDDREATAQAVARLGAQQEVLDFLNRYRAKDGSYRWIEWRSFPAGRLIYAVARDITERKLAEEALRESMTRLQTIVTGAPIILFSFDRNGIFTLSEGTGLAGMGLKPGEVVGRSVFEVYRDRPEILDNMRRSLAGETFNAPVTVGDHVFDAYHTPLPSEHGAYAGTIGVLVDVTERSRAEAERNRLQEQLQQAMKMEAIGRLAGGVAHDFNNLLTSIKGNVELARMQMTPCDPVEQHLAEVVKAADSAAALTRQLLAFSRRQIIEPRVLNLNDLVENLRKMLVRIIGEDVELQLALERKLGAVRVDPGQFEQVLVNLAVNARDAMPDGGQLTIETANVQLDDDYCARHPYVTPGSFVLLAVSDTGLGMSEEVKRRLFEPFFTTKPKGRGTGLGLATIFGAVRQAGGSIEVYSEVGHGTSFKIYLPRTDEVAGSLAVEAPSLDLPGGSETLLVVEDEDSVRQVAVHALQRLGYQVLPAATGGEALALLQRRPGRIDLLMTDVVMPGMNGRELAARLGKLHPEMKVLFTSGYAENVIVHHGVLEAELNFVGKPYSLHTLARKIREVLDSGRG